MSSTSRPLERLLTTLEYVLASEGHVSMQTLVKVAGVPKATAYRLLATLTGSGLLSHGDAETFEPGPRLVGLLQLVRDPDVVAMLARPVVTKLASEIGETSYMARLVGKRIEIVFSVMPEGQSYAVRVKVGREIAFNAAATAKAIFAFQPEPFIRSLIDQPLVKMTAHTIDTHDGVLDEYARVRTVGYATCLGEMTEGIGSLAVPVPIPKLGVAYAVAVTGPIERIFGDRKDTLIDALQKGAAELSTLLSFAKADGTSASQRQRGFGIRNLAN